MEKTHLMDLVIRVEERMNCRFVAEGCPRVKGGNVARIVPTDGVTMPGMGSAGHAALEEALRRRGRSETAADFVLKLLPQRGYALKDGQPDCVRFYKQALIAPDVWSTFLSHTHAPSKTTLFRIVFALRMSEEEARKLLSLAGLGFSATDLTDQLVLACLDCGFYDSAVVYDIFEFYREANAGRGRALKNIYGSPR